MRVEAEDNDKTADNQFKEKKLTHTSKVCNKTLRWIETYAGRFGCFREETKLTSRMN
jgi:hypothetical protein